MSQFLLSGERYAVTLSKWQLEWGNTFFPWNNVHTNTHTNSLVQRGALLSQLYGMNVTEGSLIAQHFTVDGSHHELLHLPLMHDTKIQHYTPAVIVHGQRTDFMKLTMDVLGDDTWSLIAASSCWISFSSSWTGWKYEKMFYFILKIRHYSPKVPN